MTIETNAPSSAALQGAYHDSNSLLAINVGGIAEHSAAERPRADMNNIIWVVGHVGYWRHEMADAAGIARPDDLPDVSRFRGIKRDAPKDTEGWSLEAVVDLCESGLDRMNAAFAAATEGAPGSAEFIAMAGQLLVHEAYTVGQVAALRRLAGYAGAT